MCCGCWLGHHSCVAMLMGYNVYLGGEKTEMDGKRRFFWILIEKHKKVCVTFISFSSRNMFIANTYDKKQRSIMIY